MSGDDLVGVHMCEPTNGLSKDQTRDELRYRLRQQSLLGEFGRSALQTRDIGKILQSAAELCAQGLAARFAKVLEYLPKEDRLLVRAGVGWKPGTIDNTTLGADLESPAEPTGARFRLDMPLVAGLVQ